jgi:hypothetical protein
MHMVSYRAEALPVRPNENQGPTILGATMTVTIAALITMIARLYVRIRMIRNVGWDVSIPVRGEGLLTDFAARTMS